MTIGRWWWVGAILLMSGCELFRPDGAIEVEVNLTLAGRAAEDPDGVLVHLDGGPGRRSPGGVLLENVSPGTHTVHVTDVAANCSFGPTTPQEVFVFAGGTSRVSFGGFCQ